MRPQPWMVPQFPTTALGPAQMAQIANPPPATVKPLGDPTVSVPNLKANAFVS
jgi:hypothetical protein